MLAMGFTALLYLLAAVALVQAGNLWGGVIVGALAVIGLGVVAVLAWRTVRPGFCP